MWISRQFTSGFLIVNQLPLGYHKCLFLVLPRQISLRTCPCRTVYWALLLGSCISGKAGLRKESVLITDCTWIVHECRAGRWIMYTVDVLTYSPGIQCGPDGGRKWRNG